MMSDGEDPRGDQPDSPRADEDWKAQVEAEKAAAEEDTPGQAEPAPDPVTETAAGEEKVAGEEPPLAEPLPPGARPPPLRATIAGQVSRVLRMDVQDLVINQSFRRDIFRPATSSASVASDTVLNAMILHLLKPVDGDSLTIEELF